MAMAVACSALVAGCSAAIEPSTGDLVPATDAQFMPPVSIALTGGGPDTGETFADHYWLTSDTGALTVTNSGQASPVVFVSMHVVAPPCPGARASVEVTGDGITRTYQADAVTGAIVDLRLTVARGGADVIGLKVLTPLCTAPGGAGLYLGLWGLSTG